MHRIHDNGRFVPEARVSPFEVGVESAANVVHQDEITEHRIAGLNPSKQPVGIGVPLALIEIDVAYPLGMAAC